MSQRLSWSLELLVHVHFKTRQHTYIHTLHCSYSCLLSTTCTFTNFGFISTLFLFFPPLALSTTYIFFSLSTSNISVMVIFAWFSTFFLRKNNLPCLHILIEATVYIHKYHRKRNFFFFLLLFPNIIISSWTN